MSLSERARWQTVAGLALGIFTAIVGYLAVSHNTDLPSFASRISLIVVAGSIALLVLSFALAIDASRRERQGRQMGLRFPASRVSWVDPMRIGVKVPDPTHEELAETYLKRTSDDVDANLDRAVAEALDGRDCRWIVMVEGRSTVGKSRTLFEALLRYDTTQKMLRLLAPSNATALRDLLDPSKGGLKFKGPAVLWLDDIERFLNGDVSVDEMLSWSSGEQGRIVAATRGSITLTGDADVLPYLRRNIRPIPLKATDVTELDPWSEKLGSEFNAVKEFGLAAYLIAGNRLADRLASFEAERCPEGVAVVHAAIDWARCGRADPVSRTVLSQLWPAYTDGPYTEDRFKAGLNWALRNVAGSIAPLQPDDGEGTEGYRAYPYLLQLRTEEDAGVPRDEAWAAALESGSPVQSLAVANAAYSSYRWGDAAIGFTRVATAPPDVVSAEIAADAWGNAATAHRLLGQHEKALAALQQIIDGLDNASDSAQRVQVAKALHLKGQLLARWPDPKIQALSAWQRVIDDYFLHGNSAIRTEAAAAVRDKGKLLAPPGWPDQDRKDKEALETWQLLIDDYSRAPDLQDDLLRQRVAATLTLKADLLGKPGHRDPQDKADEDEALATYRQVIQDFAGTFERYYAVFYTAMILTRRARTARRRSAVAETAARDAIQTCEQLLVVGHALKPQVGQQHPQSNEFNELIAVAYNVKAGMLAFFHRPIEEVRAVLARLINDYGDAELPTIQKEVAKARNLDGNILAGIDHLADQAREQYERVINDYQHADVPFLREQVEYATRALERLPGGGPQSST